MRQDIEFDAEGTRLSTEYEPGAYIDKIGPTPLLMVVAAKDHLTVVDQALQAFNQALEPKKVEILPGGHFDAYVEPDFARASAAARDWFVEHLAAARVRVAAAAATT